MSRGIAPVPDGPVGHGRPAYDDSQLQVIGSSIDADTGELTYLAALLEGVGDALRDAAGRVAVARQAVAASTSWAPTSGRQAQLACRVAQSAVLDASRQADDVVDRLRAAAEAYAEAEAAARNRFVLELANGRLIFGINPVRMLHVSMLTGVSMLLRGQWTPSDPQFGYFLEEMSWTFTGGPLYPDWAPMAEDRIQLLATVTSAIVTSNITVQRGFTPTGVELERMWRGYDLAGVRSGPVNAHGAADVGDLNAGISDLYYGAGVPAGTIRLDRVTGANGEVFWQVYIPGTQTQRELGDPDTGGPFGAAVANEVPQDWATNLQVFTGQENPVQNGVIAALGAAGVGAGEPVLLAGHSQGAMVAMAVANSPVVRRSYDVRSVVTFGGPVGHMRTPEGAATLNVEHEGDLTPGLENEANPVEPNRTTVRRDIAASDDPEDAGVVSVTQAHDLPAYQRTAEMIDSSDQGPITSWRAQSADVLAGDTATVETYYYVLRREEW